jgi:hypothetical protein
MGSAASSQVTPGSYAALTMPSKHPRIAVTADPELGEAEFEAGRNRREAAKALFEAMDGAQFDLDLAAVDRLNAPPTV